MLKRIAVDDMLSVITETIDAGGRFKLYPRGTSMLPMIREGRTAVSLVKADTVSKGDVVFYQRADGQYVLHRCVYIHNDEYIMCGDNQFDLEHGITGDMIIAKIDGYYSDDKFYSTEDRKYKRYVFFLPLRRVYKRIKNLIYCCKRKILKN